MVRGEEFIHQLCGGLVLDAKMVFNARGAIVLSGKRQHRDEKAEDISYEDDYRGNALAAMLRRNEIEVRFHRDFRDECVAQIVTRLLRETALGMLSPVRVMYQGRIVLEESGWQKEIK